MANLSISSGGKAIETKNIKVRELKDDITLEQAIEKTSANGMDEAFVEADGKRYVIFSEDNVDLAKAQIQLDGKAASVIKFSNEINSFGEGLSYVPKKGYNVAKTALKPVSYVVPNFTTGVAVATGIASGVIARNSFTPFMGNFEDLEALIPAGMAAGGLTGAVAYGKSTLRDKEQVGFMALPAFLGSAFAGGLIAGGIANAGALPKTAGAGIAAGAVLGVASATAAADRSSKSSGEKTVRAWATGVGSVALGAVSPEIVKLAAKIQIPELAVKGAKIAGVAALVGGTMATVGLAAAGALKSAKNETIDEIAK